MRSHIFIHLATTISFAKPACFAFALKMGIEAIRIGCLKVKMSCNSLTSFEFTVLSMRMLISRMKS